MLDFCMRDMAVGIPDHRCCKNTWENVETNIFSILFIARNAGFNRIAFYICFLIGQKRIDYCTGNTPL